MANAMYYVSQHQPATKLGVIYQNDAYGQDGLKGFTAGVSAYNLNKVASATYNATDTAFTSLVLAMKNAGASVVVATGMSQFLAVQKQYYPSQVPDGYYMYGYCLALMERNVLAKAIANKDLSRPGVLNAKLNLGTVDFGGSSPALTTPPTWAPPTARRASTR